MTRKRGNGEGSVGRPKGGGWIAQYFVETPVGDRKRRTLYGKTRVEVAAKLARAIAARDGGLVFDAEGLSVEDHLKRWLKDSVKGSVSPVTHQSYERLVRVHIAPALGRVKLKTLGPAHLQGLYRSKLDAGFSPRTVQYLHVVLHRALKQALRWNLVPRNVAEAVDPPWSTRKDVSPLSPAQARALLDAARGTRLEALYVLAVHTGMRQGELLALRWDDVDLDAGVLRVRGTKTARSRRSVKLSRTALQALQSHLERQLAEIDRASSSWRENGLVFATHTGTPMDRHNLLRQFRRLLEEAGLPAVTFHNLRHTCATVLLSKGMHAKFVQELLGHSTITITLDTYSHVLPGMGDGLADAMDDLMG